VSIPNCEESRQFVAIKVDLTKKIEWNCLIGCVYRLTVEHSCDSQAVIVSRFNQHNFLVRLFHQWLLMGSRCLPRITSHVRIIVNVGDRQTDRVAGVCGLHTPQPSTVNRQQIIDFRMVTVRCRGTPRYRTRSWKTAFWFAVLSRMLSRPLKSQEGQFWSDLYGVNFTIQCVRAVPKNGKHWLGSFHRHLQRKSYLR
jgi:hypothetical protein